MVIYIVYLYVFSYLSVYHIKICIYLSSYINLFFLLGTIDSIIGLPLIKLCEIIKEVLPNVTYNE
jgi:hypothetical protein